jgi:uncharacterized protein YjbJ (UPF0337 family)
MKSGEFMTSGSEDQIKGKVHQVQGDAKEKVGKLTGDADLEAEGKDENLQGKIQSKIGQIKKVFDQ